MLEKRCPKCDTLKPLIIEFWHKSCKTKDGFQGFCKVCRNKHKKFYRSINKQRINLSEKEYYQRTNFKRDEYFKSYRQLESTKERLKKYAKENCQEIKVYKKEYIKNKYNTDVSFKLHSCFAANFRNCLRKANIIKKSSCFTLVGYTEEELMKHLEKQFDEKMSWGNYGSYWHVDHIKPIASYNITSYDCESFKQCWSLNNLRPLEAKENLRKGAKEIK